MVRAGHTGYFFSEVGIKDYNAMTNGRNFFNQFLRSDIKTYENIKNHATVQENDYKAVYLLYYPYSKGIIS